MMKFWSAALIAAIVVALPAAAMARPHKARAVSSHIHAAGAHHGTLDRRSAGQKRVHRHQRAAKAFDRHRSARAARAHHRAQYRAHRRAWIPAAAHRAYAYAPAVEPNQWTTPTAQARPMVSTRQADGARVGGLVAPLAQKAAQIASACGAQVISGVRHTRVAGSGRMSLHASGQAVDMRGNPGCIYRMLGGWSGGYSTDYGRVKHVHISWGGREQGLRFSHGGGRSRHAHGGGRARWAGRMHGRRG
ncbi:hypothetical protein [Rhodoplanes roseus]|uniref:hypothetical protein n=1 Tax=Rhodoplanes roseus TaxID=29409 RepID=UPI001AECFB40|nr:hypothetical protein [Rhodoplanes roseus]